MATNLQIKFIKSLQQKKNRIEHRRFVCEGSKIVTELIESRSDLIDTIYATEAWVGKFNFSNSKLEVIPSSELSRMSSLETCPEILAVVHFFEEKRIVNDSKLCIYLDGISDPGNMGTIIRTAEWFGVKHIYISPNSVDIYNSKVVQSSMGSLFRIQIEQIEGIDLLKREKFKSIITTVMHGQNLFTALPMTNILLVMGSESHGISTFWNDLATHPLTIPNLGVGESLNVSVATGIFLSHLLSVK